MKKYSKCLIYKKQHGDKIDDGTRQQIMDSPLSELLVGSPVTLRKVKWTNEGLINANKTIFYFQIPIKESIHGKYFCTSFVQYLEQFVSSWYAQGEKLIEEFKLAKHPELEKFARLGD